MVNDSFPIRLMRTGQLARVTSVFGRSDSVCRLNEMGLREGVLVEMVQPGNPCIVRYDGGKLCIRDNEALSIFVTTNTSDVGSHELAHARTSG